jgi:N-formylmaleamate deformylase
MADTLALRTQSHLIDLPAGRFHYVSWGAERTALPCVVLLHGITSSALSWVRVGPALADRYRVYALDMRGHGKSMKPSPGTYTIRQTADDAAAFIEALDLPHPIVIGHSWGGATALVLAGDNRPERPAPPCAQIILEDPAHAFGRVNQAERIAFYTRDIGRPADELRREITADNPGWTAADIEGKIDALHNVTREAVTSVFAQAAQEGELLPLLASIATPVLLLRADTALETTLNDDDWQQAREYLPASGRAVQIDGATHNIHRSKFDEFMQAVNDFLAH